MKPMLPPAYGRQCADDYAFKAAARLHQSRYRVENLAIPEFREYGSRLPTDAALAGKNFYPWPGLLDAVARRFGRGDKKLYWDMLASDHIPFNFFIPLRDRPLLAQALVETWSADSCMRILRIDIEWAPGRGVAYLNDNTSFDAYVEYEREDGSLAGVGIEVKYTEREYGWGERERGQMLDPYSLYHRVHNTSDLYNDGAITELATRRLKQFWRNQLLGEAMLQARQISRFTSVILHPAANEHFVRASARYAELLRTRPPTRFRAVTYESFIDQCRKHDTTAEVAKWLGYLESRYIVASAG